MARPDRHGENRKKTAEEGPRHAQEEEAEQVEAEVEQKQARDTAQDQLGNQGVAEMLGLPSVKPGQAGLATEGDQSRETQTELLLGGDDLPPDGPLTLDDLVRSWNPTTRRGQDSAEHAEGALAGMPPEDDVLLEAVRADRTPVDLPASAAADALLQPSPGVIGADLGPFVRQAAAWASSSVLHRAWARLLSPPAAVLTDPHGRLVFTRARASALATLLVLDGPAIPAREGLPVVSFTLELACRSSWVDDALDQVRAAGVRLPLAAQVMGPLVEPLRDGTVEPRALPPAALLHLRAAIAELLGLPSAATVLPSLVAPPVEPEDDDPLGLDALVAGMTGGTPDPMSGVYEAALQAAEKLAAAGARLRVHAAGTLAAIGSVCELWTSGAPTAQLTAVGAALDRDVGQVLQLLVEIGRAVQSRSVAPTGLRTGLKRAARMLDTAADQLAARVDGIVGGVLPGSCEVPPPPVPVTDVLSESWTDGTPAAAVPWLEAQAPSLERDVAVAFTRLAAGEVAPAGLTALSERATTEGRPSLAGAIALCAGAACLRLGAAEEAARLAEVQLAAGLERRNGAWVAAAALQGIEAHRLAGRDDRAAELRHRAARTCWHLGARASLSLLLRWRPPDPDA